MHLPCFSLCPCGYGLIDLGHRRNLRLPYWGAEWMEYHRFQAAAKGYTPNLNEKVPVPLPGSQSSLPGEPLLLDNEEKGS
jgi:hypothetical protein